MNEIKYRVSFYDDDDNKGKYYIRVDGTRDGNKKVKWYDNYFDALNDMENNLPCCYPYFQMVEAICCNKFLFSNGHYDRAHEEALEYENYQQRLDKVLSKFYDCDDGIYIYDYNKLDTIEYLKWENKFYLHISKDYKEISLETVESLLKDLNNENS